MLIKCHISATKKTKSSSPELQPDLSGEGKKIFCQFFRKVIAHTVLTEMEKLYPPSIFNIVDNLFSYPYLR